MLSIISRVIAINAHISQPDKHISFQPGDGHEKGYSQEAAGTLHGLIVPVEAFDFLLKKLSHIAFTNYKEKKMDTVKAFCKAALMVICFLTVVTLASPAIADVYTYTGAPFITYDTRYGYDYTGMTNISGTITTPSLLAPNTSYSWSWDSGNAPPTYSFTDGQHVITNAGYNSGTNGTLLEVGTDAQGHITSWWIDVSTAGYSGPPYPSATFFFHGVTPDQGTGHTFTEGFAGLGQHGYYASTADGQQGSWTGGGAPPVTTPEPSTMLLLGSGLIGLAGLRRKFKK